MFPSCWFFPPMSTMMVFKCVGRLKIVRELYVVLSTWAITLSFPVFKKT